MQLLLVSCVFPVVKTYISVDLINKQVYVLQFIQYYYCSFALNVTIVVSLYTFYI